MCVPFLFLEMSSGSSSPLRSPAATCVPTPESSWIIWGIKTTPLGRPLTPHRRRHIYWSHCRRRPHHRNQQIIFLFTKRWVHGPLLSLKVSRGTPRLLLLLEIWISGGELLFSLMGKLVFLEVCLHLCIIVNNQKRRIPLRKPPLVRVLLY